MWKALKQVRSAVSLLDPEEVRKRATRKVTIGLVAASDRGYRELEDFLVPDTAAVEVRKQLLGSIYRAGDRDAVPQVDLILYEAGLPCPRGAFRYRRDDPVGTITEILKAHEELGLALARRLPTFRKPLVDRIVQSVSRENALFAVTTALPNVVPNLLELPWAFGEFASDTAFLTVNQIRMAFLIAAAWGAEVGYSQQKFEIATIATGAFGWRALARELAGKIPLGAGLIPKGAIAYAGTYLVGKALERYHGAAGPYTPEERDEVYEHAYQHGKAVAESVARDVS